jgi:hypothetical protein
MELAELAEKRCAAMLQRTAQPSHYIAGFTTRHGRQLALERTRNSIYCWTEPVPMHGARFTPQRCYPATKSRTSGLNGVHASRLSLGRAVHYWNFSKLEDFEDFLAWYA